MATRTLSLALTPSGQVYIDAHSSGDTPIPEAAAQKIESMFSKGPTLGLLQLGLEKMEAPLPANIAFWQRFSRFFVSKLCMVAGLEAPNRDLDVALPSAQDLEEFVANAPFMRGGEYLNKGVLERLWRDLQVTLQQYLLAFGGNLQEFLKTYNPQLNLVGRVHFHLAENKADDITPFAFLATYTTRLSDHAKVQHLPLGRALKDYAGQKQTLLSLLLPVQRAAEQSPLIKQLVDSKQIFQPLLWKPHIAYDFLQAIPIFESAGIIVRVPNWWSPKKPPRAKVSVTIGKAKAAAMDISALLDFNIEMALPNGQTLKDEDLEKIFNTSENLVLIKGQWIEIDRQKLQDVLQHWTKIKDGAAKDGLSFAEAMRLLAGVSYGDAEDSPLSNACGPWSRVVAGDWLKNTLKQLRNPEADSGFPSVLKQHLQATLRPYQCIGVNWLWLLYNLRLGGCLADDMGLGKTIQVLGLLLLIKHTIPSKTPGLLIIPASLLGNWLAEIDRFAPGLKVWVAHSSLASAEELKTITKEKLLAFDLVITTYGFVQRLNALKETKWDVLILDEAQQIKNPATKQTRSVKALDCRVRLTLTGTPIENQLGDLWSLFDFICPGLLGSNRDFKKYVKNNADQEDHFYGALRTLVGPYILRRLKSDKRILNDLPDKTEVKAFCPLSKRQVSLYQQSVEEFARQLETADGIQRRGMILAYLMRFKQICNHPSQWLGHGSYDLEDSGKFARLKEICEEIAAKQEKVLIFTQFTEIMPALASFLAPIFGQSGLLLHGKTPIKDRGALVRRFQEELGPPFFVLSLKAGGTGLNLTQASHVIHFDRWWNPAVENQATDRAYRIGQHKNVLVHAFICRGTIEEKIDLLIDSKKELSRQLLAGGSETLLTELTNEDLMSVVSLDIHRALAED